MELPPPPLPAKGWKVTLAVCGPGPKEGVEVDEDAKKVGEPEDEEQLFWPGSVILS